MTTLLRTVTLLALLAPSAAFAGKVALTPLIMDASVNAKQRQAVYQLISSELDFAPEVEGVAEVNTPPTSLDDACLANPKCLAGIASANGATSVLTGKMSTSGANFVLDVVYFDGAKIARRKQFTVPQDATALANAMTPIVHEVLTGSGPKDKVAAAPTKTTDLAGDDEIAIGGGAALTDAVIGTPRMAPVAAATPPPPPPAPTKPAAATKPLPSSGDRRVAAATAATSLASGTSAPTAPTPAPSDDELARMINFGGSANDITAEQINGRSAAPAPAPTPAPVVRPAPAPVSHARDRDLEAEEEELAPHPIRDLDGPTKGPKNKPPATPRQPSGGNKSELGHVVQITGRGGFTKYYKFNFITAGGELGVAAVKGLHVIAGMEVYGVKRVLPPELQLSTGIYSQWNYIFPLNVGAIYKFPLGVAQPYIGADAIFVQYYKDEYGADWAGGGRLRLGTDLMVIPNFGFNINASIGAWSGSNWGIIEQGVAPAGLLPEISAGTVFAF